MYYIPYICGPLFSLIAVLKMVINNNSVFKKQSIFFSVVSFALVLLVLTNDLHQLVFGYDKTDIEVASNHHSYRIGYYLAMGWLLFMVMYMLYKLIKNGIVSEVKKKIYIPVIIFFTGIFSVIISMLNHNAFFQIPELLCLTFASFLESCIEIGLIPSNNNYEVFYKYSGLPSIIVNANGDVEASTVTDFNSINSDNKYVIKKESPINGGSILWLEDHSEIYKMNEELAEIQEQLQDESMLLTAENELKEREERIKTKNDLYDSITEEVKLKLSLLNEFINEAEKLSSLEEYSKILKKATILTSYIKRRCNLILISESEEKLNTNDLANCLRESLIYLKIYGISANLRFSGECLLEPNIIMEIYDCFENIIENNLDSIVAINIFADFSKQIRVNLMFGVKDDSFKLDFYPEILNVNYSLDDDTAYITLTLKGGDE